jgi:hypothetical protein
MAGSSVRLGLRYQAHALLFLCASLCPRHQAPGIRHIRSLSLCASPCTSSMHTAGASKCHGTTHAVRAQVRCPHARKRAAPWHRTGTTLTCVCACAGALFPDGHCVPPEAIDGRHHQWGQRDHGADCAAQRAASSGGVREGGVRAYVYGGVKVLWRRRNDKMCVCVIPWGRQVE